MDTQNHPPARAPSQTIARLGRIGFWLVPALLVFVLYSQVGGHRFIDYDDNLYTYDNPYVSRGLTADGVRWAWTQVYTSNYHPLTWLSHMVDVELFGLHAGSAALENAALHALNSVLIALLFAHLFKGRLYGLVAGALFATHPVLVEAVAWVSQRKTLLATAFALGSILSHLRATRTGGKDGAAPWQVLSLFLYACSLLSKGMFVTLPGILVVLHLIREDQEGRGWPNWRTVAAKTVALWPYFLLALGGAIVTFLAQRADGAVVTAAEMAWADRLATAAAGYRRYLWHSLAPFDLVPMYPLQAATAAGLLRDLALLLGVAALAVLVRRSLGFSALGGWLLFVGMLLPVIGLVQVGRQALADRYLYPPLLGLIVIVIAAIKRIHERPPPAIAAVSRLWPVPVAGWVMAMAAVSWGQIGLWSDTYTLVSDYNQRRGDSTLFLCLESRCLVEQGRFPEALERTRRAYQLNPRDMALWTNIGVMEMLAGNQAEADRLLRQLVQASPDNAQNQVYFALVLRQAGKWDEVKQALESVEKLERKRATLTVTERGIVDELRAGLAKQVR